MLRLASRTRPGWLDEALASIDTIVLDHAHCEKKAASTAISLLFRYPDHTALMRPLSELAREELQHFEQVLEVIADRGGVFERQHPSTYAKRLCTEIRTSEPWRLVDTLLCCALIEARSCERMQLLAENLEDEGLAGLYRGLHTSEARHHQIYVDLAAGVVGLDLTLERLDVLAAHEAAVLSGGEQAVRLHS